MKVYVDSRLLKETTYSFNPAKTAFSKNGIPIAKIIGSFSGKSIEKAEKRAQKYPDAKLVLVAWKTGVGYRVVFERIQYPSKIFVVIPAMGNENDQAFISPQKEAKTGLSRFFPHFKH